MISTAILSWYDLFLISKCSFVFFPLLFQAGPHPPFKAQSQNSPGLESQMDPKPDYGYTSYKGSGKLQGKVAIITGIKASGT
jgi:hypothetical protein